MVMKDCLEKNVQKKVLIEKHREYYLVLDEETGAIVYGSTVLSWKY